MKCPGCADQPIPGQVPTPDGSMYQLCPSCQGSGQWNGPGTFWPYELDFVLLANQTQVGTILIRTGFDYLWKFAIAKRTSTFTYLLDINGNQIQTVFNVQGQSAAGLQDANFWGTNAANMFPLPDPIWVRSQQRLNISVTDTSGAGNTLNLTLIGAHFPADPQAGTGSLPSGQRRA